jgi:hypothetical protein
MAPLHQIGPLCCRTSQTGGSIAVRALFANGLLWTGRIPRILLPITPLLTVLPKPIHPHAAKLSSRPRR